MRRDRGAPLLSTAQFKREFLRSAEEFEVKETFGSRKWVEASPHRWVDAGTDRLVEEIEGVIGDGKEATVYQCRLAPEIGIPRAVAKVYRPPKFRAFSNASQYVDPSQVRDRRSRRALEKKTRKGKQLGQRMWIEREWETIKRAWDAGADVPEPFAHSTHAVLMELIGDASGPAPPLHRVRLSGAELRRAFDDLIRNVATLLGCDRVHGDLSAYNVLFWEGRTRVIDLPQAVPASAPDAFSLLHRDVRNLCAYFARHGLSEDGAAIADDLWRMHLRGQL